jgi:hypothetical protein
MTTKCTFKSSSNKSKAKTANLAAEALPIIGDKLQFPGEPAFEVVGRTFVYDDNFNVIEIQFYLA